MCACVYACATSSLVLLTSNINKGLIINSTLLARVDDPISLSWVPTAIVKIKEIKYNPNPHRYVNKSSQLVGPSRVIWGPLMLI